MGLRPIPELRLVLEERDKQRPCIVEGICLRTVLDACGLYADYYLYIRRVGQNGIWYDQLHLEAFEDAVTLDGDESEPFLSDLKYHSQRRPHELADLTFDRVEE